MGRIIPYTMKNESHVPNHQHPPTSYSDIYNISITSTNSRNLQFPPAPVLGFPKSSPPTPSSPVGRHRLPGTSRTSSAPSRPSPLWPGASASCGSFWILRFRRSGGENVWHKMRGSLPCFCFVGDLHQKWEIIRCQYLWNCCWTME